MLGLGSPKYDKVAETKRENTDIPLDWLRVIQKPDGSWKKVIFYNTSVAALLDGNDEMLEKIRDTLRVFKENQENAALLWRPHPLIQATIESMRPQLWQEYQEIVRQYRTENWGIYDDSADMNRAIAVSDAYYGDPSSLAQLYQKTGKPAMIQNIHILNHSEEDDFPVWPSAMCVDGDDVWFMHGRGNLLMKYSIKTRRVEVIGSVPEERMLPAGLYLNIHKCGNKLFLIPAWGREIAVYFIDEGRYQKIALKDIENYQGKHLFYRSIEKKGIIYCIPYHYQAILKINTEELSIEYGPDCVGAAEERTGGKGLYCNAADFIEDNIIAGVFLCNNLVFTYNTETDELSMHEAGDKNRGYAALIRVKDSLLLYDWHGKVFLQYSLKTGTVRERRYTKDGSANLTRLDQNHILVDFNDKDGFMILDGQMEEMGGADDASGGERRLQYPYCGGVVAKGRVEGKTLYYDKAHDVLCFWDGQNMASRRRLGITLEQKRHIFDRQELPQDIVQENDFADVYALLSCCNEGRETLHQENLGMKIFREIQGSR